MNKKNTLLSTLFLLFVWTLAAQEPGIDFIENKQQFPEPVLFKASLPGGAVFLRSDGFTYNYYNEKDLERIHDHMHENKEVEKENVNFHAYQVSFIGAHKNPEVTTAHKQTYYHNYFLGNDSRYWASNVGLYKTVKYAGIYDGIDAIVYSQGNSLKYDFIVQPGSDPKQIVLGFEGVTPRLLKDGSLSIETSVNKIKELAPYVYQEVNGQKVKVASKYKMLPGNRIGFDLPAGYNTSLPLVIDPVLVFSTFSGSTAMTFGFSATYDLSGNLYAGGECFAVGWPVTLGAYQGTFGNAVDAGINKYSSNGNTLLYATYYGGSGSDLPNNMMVNANSELVICGSTSSGNLPVTTGCYDNTLGGFADIYIARFSANGAVLKAATYLGGSAQDGTNTGSLSPNYGDGNRGEVLTASNGSIYIACSSSSIDFPVTAGAYQTTSGGQQDGVVCRLDSNLTTLMYSTYLGGSGNDACFSLVLNSNSEVVVCGGTSSTNFPTVSGALHTASQGGTDGFVSILNLSTGLTHSSYLGTNTYDHAFKVQIDPADNVFVMGQTSGTYPVSAGVYSVANGNIFIDKLSPTLSSSLASTRMGNSNGISFVPTAFLHDVCGNTYLSGFQAAASSPVTPGTYQSAPGSFWLGALSPGFTSLLYATFMGPTGTHVDGGTSRFDPQGIIYHSACTSNGSFPTTTGVFAPIKLSSSWDIASFKFNMEVGAVYADFILANNANDTGCADYAVTFQNMSYGATNYLWLFGDGSTSTAVSPSHTFTEGLHTVSLVASGPNGCNLSDTATMDIFVKHTDKPLINLPDTFLCDPVTININAGVSNLNNTMGFRWEPANAVIGANNQSQVNVNPALSNTFTVYVSNSADGDCVDSATATMHINLFDYNNMNAFPIDTTICPGDTITVRAYGGARYLWSPNERINDVTIPFATVWAERERTYKVLIESDSGCKIERSVNIHLLPLPVVDAGRDKDIKPGEPVTLDGRAEGSYTWIPAVDPPGMKPTVRPTVTTTYYLTTTTEEGCVAIDSVTIHVTDAWLPNAFSPNGDGINDLFFLIPKDERVKLKDFSIYNRYGQRVFYSQDIKVGWDGYDDGKPADLNVYFYLVRYIIGEKTYTLKGDVTLIR